VGICVFAFLSLPIITNIQVDSILYQIDACDVTLSVYPSYSPEYITPTQKNHALPNC
jgi:hypothetical protein